MMHKMTHKIFQKNKIAKSFFFPNTVQLHHCVFTLTLDAVALTLKSAFSSVIAVDTAER